MERKTTKISNGVERKTHTIDASERSLGKIAVEIAILLRGKHKPTFVPHKDEGDFVIVKNIKKIKITGKKMSDKIYYRHTGYLGGLKEVPLEKIFKKDPGEVLKKAIWGMLPKNKLRKEQIKRLKFYAR